MTIYGMEDAGLPDLTLYLKSWHIDSMYGEQLTVTLTCIAHGSGKPETDRREARIAALEAEVARYKAILE